VRFPGILVLWIVLGSTAMPVHGNVTAGQLRQWCDAWERVFVSNMGTGAQDAADGASCSAFIAGTLEGAAALSSQLNGTDRSAARLPAIGLCHPGDQGYQSLIEAVRRYLERRPGSGDEDAATLVFEAVQSEFPCERV
jgi:hypothetical protein